MKGFRSCQNIDFKYLHHRRAKKKGDRQGRNSIVRLQQRSADQGTQHDRNPDQSGSHGNSQIKTKIRKAGTSSSPNHPPADYRLPANLGSRWQKKINDSINVVPRRSLSRGSAVCGRRRRESEQREANQSRQSVCIINKGIIERFQEKITTQGKKSRECVCMSVQKQKSCM